LLLFAFLWEKPPFMLSIWKTIREGRRKEEGRKGREGKVWKGTALSAGRHA
jgi:hypothetical protein